MRFYLPVIFCALASCVGGSGDVTQREAELLVLAEQKTKGSRYPVLGTLPDDAPGPSDFAPDMAPELRSRAIELVSLAENAGRVADPVTTETTVVELLSLVQSLQQKNSDPDPLLDVKALDFPTPPPLER